MTNTEEMATVALWMMIIGGLVGIFGLGSILLSDGMDRGNLSKPMTIVGFALLLLGIFLNNRWGSYW